MARRAKPLAWTYGRSERHTDIVAAAQIESRRQIYRVKKHPKRLVGKEVTTEDCRDRRQGWGESRK